MGWTREKKIDTYIVQQRAMGKNVLLLVYEHSEEQIGSYEYKSNPYQWATHIIYST